MATASEKAADSTLARNLVPQLSNKPLLWSALILCKYVLIAVPL